MFRRIRPWLSRILGLFLLYVGVVLVHGTLTDWRPTGNAPATLLQHGQEGILQDSILSFTIWNVGYTGLGAESDFFYDAGGFFLSKGHMVRSPQALVQKNMDGVRQSLASLPSDFFLLHEVDSFSKRSHFMHGLDSVKRIYPDYMAAYAPNYRSERVPLPILEPWKAYGRVNSGIMTLSKYMATENTRMQLPGAFPWPTRIFNLDRCLLLSRYPTRWGKDVVVVNAHLSAYDKTGELKRQEMAFLKKVVLEEYAKGHFVIVGADWNQCPPNMPFDALAPDRSEGFSQINIAHDFLPEGWQWLYDPATPSNRKTPTTYDPKTSFVTVIDFYLASPNIQALQVKTIDQQFRYSDHQPVYLKIALLPEL